MTFFSDILSIGPCMHILDQIILLGSQALTSIMKFVYLNSKEKILAQQEKQVHPLDFMRT